MGKVITVVTVILLIITIIVLAVKGVLAALVSTHWLVVIGGLLLLTNKYFRKAVLVALITTCILYLFMP